MQGTKYLKEKSPGLKLDFSGTTTLGISRGVTPHPTLRAAPNYRAKLR